MNEPTDHESKLREIADGDWQMMMIDRDDQAAVKWALAELDRLRARVAELEARLAARPATPEPPPRSPFERERALYAAHKEALLAAGYEGQYFVLKDASLYGPEPTYEEALRRGYAVFGLTSFMVKQVTATEPVLHMVPH